VTWKKEPAYTGTVHQGCLNCSPVTTLAGMDLHVAVGFGMAAVTKDGRCVYSEEPDADYEDIPTLQTFEDMARADPDHDWRLILEAPLRSREYQRHRDDEWVLIASGQGFA
jgi:hypothetical protein